MVLPWERRRDGGNVRVWSHRVHSREGTKECWQSTCFLLFTQSGTTSRDGADHIQVCTFQNTFHHTCPRVFLLGDCKSSQVDPGG